MPVEPSVDKCHFNNLRKTSVNVCTRRDAKRESVPRKSLLSIESVISGRRMRDIK